MKLLDTNIILYAADPTRSGLLQLVLDPENAVSIITFIEALGYHKITPAEKEWLESVFAVLKVLPVSKDIAEKSVRLRQQQKMSLGDALIAATALEHNLELVTHNTADFTSIPSLKVVDPLL